MLKIYIYIKSVHFHGHKYIKLRKQNKRMRRGEPEGGKEWEPEVDHGWVIGEWKVEMETQEWAQKRGAGRSRGGEG
jgi:hypothetical protein